MPSFDWSEMAGNACTYHCVPQVWEVGKIIGQKWREMPDEDKQPYFEEYEQEKVIYNEQLKAYRSSPAYKRWVEAKQHGK